MSVEHCDVLASLVVDGLGVRVACGLKISLKSIDRGVRSRDGFVQALDLRIQKALWEMNVLDLNFS
tara:strand:- start:233 stop:430 length:198 start_codon:yes stop_codon:yes gene_type:complete